MRPFLPGFMTARFIYPILLGIILLSTAHLPSTTVSVMASAAPVPTAAHEQAAHKEPPASEATTTFISTKSFTKPVWPDLNPDFLYFCLRSPEGGAMSSVTGQDSVAETAPQLESGSDQGTLGKGLKHHPKVAIIIDDVGYTAPGTEEIVKLPITVTWAILPDTPFARDYLDLAREKQVEVMLHLPLEPLDESVNPGPGVIKGSWDEARVISQLNHDLSSVPGVVGVNNHMGSLGTQDRRLMALLMKTLHQKKLFFVDSRTTAKTVAEEYAGKYGEPFARRQVFIDNDPEIEKKKAAMRDLIGLARKEGSAIGIAHIRNGNAAAIIAMLPEFAAAGIEFVPVSQLVKWRPR